MVISQAQRFKLFAALEVNNLLYKFSVMSSPQFALVYRFLMLCDKASQTLY